MKKGILLTLGLIFCSISFAFAQAPTSLIGQTITLDYQSTVGEEESGTASFTLIDENRAWELETDDGEWESATYHWTPDGNFAYCIIKWGMENM